MNLTSFALRRGALITLILVFASVLAACSGDSDASEPADGGTGGTATVADGEVALSANDLEFDASTIEAPAGAEFTITFTNNESQPHNVAIYSEEGGDEIVVGEVITGPDADHPDRRSCPRRGHVLLPVRHPPRHERDGRRQRLTRFQPDR